MNQEIALKQSEMPVPLPNGLPLPESMPIDLALGAFREALDAWTSTTAIKESAKTDRAQIRAQVEVQIKNMELATRRGMAADQAIHEQRMELINIVGKLLVDNAQTLTPEIISAANMLLVQLREIK